MKRIFGIDVGSYASYVASQQGTGVNTVANEFGERHTPALICYQRGELFFGYIAEQKSVQSDSCSVAAFTRLLGKKFSDELCECEQRFTHAKIIELDDGYAGFELNKEKYRPEELLAIYLRKLVESAKSSIRDENLYVALSVPAYFGHYERIATLEAAEIAGLERDSVCLVNSTTAACVAFNIYNDSLFIKKNRTETIAIVDFGYSSLKVAIVKMGRTSMEVLATACDPNLGGRDFDRLIFEHILETLNEDERDRIKHSFKGRVLLMRSCEKLKQALCLTTQEVRQRVDCQVTTSDITIAMDRSCFETLTEALIHRARKTMQKALQDANLSNVTMVEAIGGSVRIPAVQVIITDVFGVKPSCKLNPDQTVARGCGLMALKMTKGYSLKSFSVIDMPSIRVYVNGKVQQGVLRVPSSKCWHIQFKHLGVKISEIPATLSTNSGIRFKISPENFRQPFLKKLLIKIISAPLRGTSIESDWIVDNNGVVSCVKFVRPDYEDTKVDVCTNYLSLECISSLRKRQDDYEIQAREKKEQKVKLNMFESCIYDAMNNLSMKPNYNKELYPLLEAALKWISSEGIRAPLQDVENRFSLTNNLIHKFEEYLQELEKTQEIIQSAFKDFDEILMKEGRKGKMSVTQILLEEIENERKDVVAYGTLIEKLVNISAGPRQLRSGLFNEVPCPEVEEASEIGYDESEKKGIRNWREISLTFQKSERDRFKDDFQRCCLSGSLDEMKNLLQYVKASDQHYSNIQKLISMLHVCCRLYDISQKPAEKKNLFILQNVMQNALRALLHQ